MSPLDPRDRNVGELVARAVDSFRELVSAHLAVTRAELASDARQFAHDVAPLGAAVPILLLGYAFVCVAAATLLSQSLGLVLGLAIVGGVHVVGGAIGVRVVVARLGDTSSRRRMTDGAPVRAVHAAATSVESTSPPPEDEPHAS